MEKKMAAAASAVVSGVAADLGSAEGASAAMAAGSRGRGEAEEGSGGDLRMWRRQAAAGSLRAHQRISETRPSTRLSLVAPTVRRRGRWLWRRRDPQMWKAARYVDLVPHY
jgi:hypothetical protein